MSLIIDRTPRTTQGFSEALSPTLDLTLVVIPGGEFTMGSAATEVGHSDSEGSIHQVTVPPFAMAQTPITQAQWRIVAGWPRFDRDLKPDPAHYKGDQHPVEHVSWHDASEFCARLTQATGRAYSLPSEAEWEYACRAGTTTPFHYGDTLTPDLACYDWSQIYADTPIEPRQRPTGTMPVGQFPANAWGLYDMHGNVWEWCQDHWHDNYRTAPRDGSAWLKKKAETDADRVFRGGSWPYNPQHCRSAICYHNDARFVNYDVGFRVVCRLPRTR